MTFYLPTTSKVRVMIHGVDLDLGFRLDWKHSQPKIPVYGYNDTDYTKTIRGRNLVQGFLVMNYVAPHYLSALLEQWDQKTRISEKLEIDELISNLPGTDTAANRIARAELLSSLLFPSSGANSEPLVDQVEMKMRSPLERVAKRGSPGVLKRAFDSGLVAGPTGGIPDIKTKLIDRFTKGTGTNIVPRIAGPGDYSTPFDMTIYHMEPEFSNWCVILEDVEITDVSQTLSAAGNDGSSDPIYETYEFIAKRRQIKEVDRPQT
jgi:hypothetical protein